VGVWGRGSSEGSNWSPGLLDRAETFAESEVTLTQEYTTVNAGAVEFAAAKDDQLFFDDEYTYISTTSSVTWETVETFSFDLSGVESMKIEMDAEEGYYTANGEIRIRNTTEGTTVFEQTSLSESTTTYTTTVDASGRSGTRTYEVQMSKDSTNSDTAVAYRRLVFLDKTVPVSGSTVVEWPVPADVAGWDIIPYEATENGGTVEVYAVDPSDGTRLAGPLDDPGDISSLSRSTNVAVEVVLERPSTAENPRLEAVYRRRKIT